MDVRSRQVWAAEMRKQFSPKDMLDDHGDINQEFFKPKCVLIVSGRRWGDEDNDRLYKGLETFGVGRWREISKQLLPSWDDGQVRARAAKLLGSQSLSRYEGWCGDRKAVQAEFAKNRAIGEATLCWKHGQLVENDQGSVKQYFKDHGG